MGMISTGILKIFKCIERVSTFAQGKGYGSATVRQEVELVLSFLKTKPILAVDIGGNIGEYTSELRRRNPKLEIHIFEPSATNVEKLKVRFNQDSLVTLVPYAVSHEAGDAVLFSNKPGSGLGGLTQRRLEHININFDITENIKTVRFEDYWLNQLNSRELDIVKIDIEGHEFSALQGFGKAINSIRVIQFEFGGCNIDTRTFFQDFWYFFKEFNFDIYRITPFGAQPIPSYLELDEFFSTTNYIAVRHA